MKRKRVKLSINELSELFERFEKSNLSLAAFGKRENIPYSTLTSYIRKFKKLSLKKKKTTPVQKKDDFKVEKTSQSFIELFPVVKDTSKPPLILRCAPFELEIPSSFDPLLLSQILKVLKKNV